MDVREASLSDQLFLINIIIGLYLGPNVKNEPRRSAFWRIAELRPPYSLNDLEPTYVTFSQLESIYHHVLRNAHQSAFLEQNSLHRFFKGILHVPSSTGEGPQFTSIFPLHLHEQTRYQSAEIIKGIVIIDNPDMSRVTPKDVERFVSLTGMQEQDLKINETEFQLYGADSEIPEHNNGNCSVSVNKRRGRKRKQRCEPMEIQLVSQMTPASMSDNYPIEEIVSARSCVAEPSMLLLSSTPKVDEWASKQSVVLTGTAREARAGPPIGLVDIGTSEDAYLFRVALPGVLKGTAGQFGCQIERSGRVHIQGVTVTGEESVERHSRVFQMMTQHLCPPGPFEISFSLPGPVDARDFSPDFRSDGIFEGVVMKLGIPDPVTISD